MRYCINEGLYAVLYEVLYEGLYEVPGRIEERAVASF